MSPKDALFASALALVSVGWLAFLAAGRARGTVKRTAFRATLLVLASALVAGGRATGLFAQAGAAGRVVVVALALLLIVSYLYLVRFCPACGRMHRNFKAAECARCQSPLPDHGLTWRPRRTALGMRRRVVPRK